MQTFVGVKAFGYRREAMFKIPTMAGEVFMSVSRSNYMNDERAVVEVESERFFELWKAEPSSLHRAQAHGDETSWRADYKFHHAVDGFAQGETNPVPLASVSCLIAHERRIRVQRKWIFFEKKIDDGEISFPYVAFTNGVTRTIWLAAHQARSFPVECSVRDAPRLQELAGTSASSWRTVEQLIPKEH